MHNFTKLFTAIAFLFISVQQGQAQFAETQDYQIEVLITKDIKSGDSEPYLDITLPSGEVIKSKVLTGKSLSNYSTLTFNVSLSESPMSIVLSDKLGNQEYGKATIDSRSQGGNAVDNSGSDAGWRVSVTK